LFCVFLFSFGGKGRDFSLSRHRHSQQKKGGEGGGCFFGFFYSLFVCVLWLRLSKFFWKRVQLLRERKVCLLFSCFALCSLVLFFFKFSLLFFLLGELLFSLHTFRNRAAELRGPKVLLIVGGGFYRPFSSQCIFCLFSLFLSTLLLKWRKEKTEQQFFILERRGRIGGDTQERAFVTEQGAHTRTRK